ncbi:MAG: SRPBCC family protein [Candidatus Dadabacteria bacterium]|nr:MAG: SRPBCC family protein [Candidatus Dadabacteria bacterium]
MNAGSIDAKIAELTSSPLQFDVEAVLGAPPETVFATITDFERMPEWMPLMKRVEVDNSNAEAPGQVGAVRVIYPPVGKPTHEIVTAFDAPTLLAYHATDESLMGMFTDHTGVLTCEPGPLAGQTRFRWRTYAKPGRNPVKRALGQRVFRYVFWHSMRKLKQRFPA